MREVRSRRRTGSLWVTPGGSPWATIDKALPRDGAATPPVDMVGPLEGRLLWMLNRAVSALLAHATRC